MFELFKKKSVSPEERIAECQRKKDYAGLAKAYYELGKSALNAGDQGRAMLWLGRADTVYSARDDVYDKVGEKITDDCSELIGDLEDAPLLINEIEAQITEQANKLEEPQILVWSLLALARLIPTVSRLGTLPGCGVLAKLEKCLDLAVQSMQEPITPDEFDYIKDVCGELYEFSDSENFFAGGEIPCPAGAPIQVYDLNGLAMLLSIGTFFGGLLHTLAGHPVHDAGEMIPCALLPDYWQRTVGGDIRNIPQVKAELERIWSDCEFVRSGPALDAVVERVERYKALDIFTA